MQPGLPLSGLNASDWLRAQAEATEEAGPVASTLLGDLFAEEPVSLDVFVRDKKFIGMSALSDPQYSVLQAAERIFYMDLYPVMAAEWSYWQPIPMVNLLTILSGKGCIVPGEEVYDSNTGQWVSIEELVSSGVVASIHDLTSSTVQVQAGPQLRNKRKNSRQSSSPLITSAPRSPSFRSGNGECYEVTTASGQTLRVFEGHQFLTWDRHDRPAKNQFRDAVPTWKQLREMKVGDRIGVASHLPCANPVRQDSREVELVGLLIGDGCTISKVRSSGANVAVSLSVGRDAPLTADRFEVLAQSVLDEECPGAEIRHRWHPDKNGELTRQCISFAYEPGFLTRSENTKDGRSGSALTSLTKRWSLHGCYAWAKRVPAEMMSLPDDQVWLLLSRLWDTDGSLYTDTVKKPKYTYENAAAEYDTSSYQLAVDVQRLLLRVGIVGRLTSRRTFFTYQGVKKEGRRSYRVDISSLDSLEYFCRNVSLLDKQADLNKCLNVIVSRKARALERRTLGLRGGGTQNPRSGDVYWDRIKSIEPIGKHDYWDITVEGTANYIAGCGIVNHNSGKDMIARLTSLRIAYLLLCLKDPKTYFGFPSDESIHMLNVASTKNQARLAFFEPMTRIVTRGWFKNRCNPLRSVIEYEKGITAISGSSDAETQEGLNLILGVADEVDAFRTAEEVIRHSGPSQRTPIRSVEGIIKMLRTSSSTRFLQTFKNLRISYPRYYGSPIMQLHAAATENVTRKGADSKHFVVGPLPSWDFNPLLARSEFVTIPQSPVPVPIELVEEFESDPEWSCAAYLCRPARTRLPPYFRNETVIDAALIEAPEITVNWELVRGAWHASFSIPRALTVAPGAVYACHADLALTGDRCGFAMAHVVSWDSYEKRDVESGERLRYEHLPVVQVDAAIVLEADLRADPPREIQLRAIRQLIFELRQRGFGIGWVSLDGWQCLVGPTMIPLLDGTEQTMEELSRRTEPFWVYSMSPEGRVVPGLCTSAQATGLREDILDVELDNGEVISCTSDHPFMLRDGTYARADSLSSDTSLMPLYRRVRPLGTKQQEYEQVWHPEKKSGERRWQWTHGVVDKYLNGPIGRYIVRHHVNFNERDNRPENLQRLTVAEHNALHDRWAGQSLKKAWQDPVWSEWMRARSSECMRAYWNDPEWKASVLAYRATVTQRFNTGRPNQWRDLWADPVWAAEHKARLSAFATQRGNSSEWKELMHAALFKHEITFQTIVQAYYAVESRLGKVPSRVDVQREIGCSIDVVQDRVRSAGFDSWISFKESMSGKKFKYNFSSTTNPKIGDVPSTRVRNHKVVSVRKGDPQIVYDLCIEKWHNFATSAGVFVHNSQETKQALIVAGIESEILSVDKTEEPYRLLRSMVEEARVTLPSSLLLRAELRGLQQDPRTRKIDHQPGTGSKDLSDSVCGSVWGAVLLGGSEVTEGEHSGDEIWTAQAGLRDAAIPVGAEAAWSSLFTR